MAAVLLAAMAASFCISGVALLASDRANDRAEELRAAGAAEQWLLGAGQDLAGSARDYARWDETWLFSEGQLPSFVTEFLTIESFENLDLDVVVVGRPGEVHLALARSVAGEGPPRLVPLAPEFLPVFLPLLERKSGDTGLVEWNGGACMFAQTPISHSDGSGENGVMWLVARELTAARLATPQRLVSGHFEFARSGAAAPAAGMRRPLVLGQGFAGWDVVVVPAARGARADRGLAAVAINTAVVGLVALLATIVLLNRLVLTRLSALGTAVVDLRAGGAADRLPVGGNDELDRLAGAINDLVAEDRRMREGAEREARQDPLTGLANRASLRERLEAELAGASAKAAPASALLFIDLDQMKRVNDHLGHAAGDAVICEVANRLAAGVKAGDLVARLGGDEFAVVLHGVASLKAAGARAEALLGVVRRPISLAGECLELTASIGVSLCREGVSAASLMKEADTAMYAAKDAGRSGWSAYDGTMHERELGRLALELALREAVRGGVIHVEFQPIVELSTGDLAGFEALARWNDPVRGAVSPAEFIPVAEEGPLIVELDASVLDQALKAFAPWRARRPGLFLTVNTSPRRFESAGFVAAVQASLARHGVEGSALLLEVTETQLGKDESVWADRVHELLALGVRVVLDDFGAGYSSLGRLRNVPVAMLKLDRCFVVDLSEGSEEVAQAIISLATALSIPVVAEGIESAEVGVALAALHCRYGQGWHHGRPMGAEAADRLVRGG